MWQKCSTFGKRIWASRLHTPWASLGNRGTMTALAQLHRDVTGTQPCSARSFSPRKESSFPCPQESLFRESLSTLLQCRVQMCSSFCLEEQFCALCGSVYGNTQLLLKKYACVWCLQMLWLHSKRKNHTSWGRKFPLFTSSSLQTLLFEDILFVA